MMSRLFDRASRASRGRVARASRGRRSALSLALAAAAAGCAPSAGPQAPPTTTAVADPAYSEATASARAVLVGAAAEGAGLAVAVMVGGARVWVEGAGWADLAERRPVDPVRTRFRAYSVSKPMTAVAAARLMERGRLDPGAAVRRYVPSFPEKAAPITPMQLATHTSGIRHYAEGEARSGRHCATVDDALGIFADDPLVHAPGAAETYSSWGYVLLSAVLERITGDTYPEAMRTLVFEPAGMSAMSIDDPTEDVAARASFYTESDGGLKPAEPVDNTCKWGAGAWLATADDVARFGSAMLDGAFLSQRSLQLFLRGRDGYRAQGLGAGGAAFLLIDAEHGVSIALLSNAIGETAGPAARAALERIHALFTAGAAGV